MNLKLSPYHIDAIQEIINIGVGRACGGLNDLLNTHIELSVPKVEVIQISDYIQLLNENILNEDLSLMKLSFNGMINGSSALLFPSSSAKKLVSLLLEDEDEDVVESMSEGTLTEIGNILLNSVMGSVSNMLQISFTYNLPKYLKEKKQHFIERESGNLDAVVLLAHTNFSVKDHDVSGEVLILFDVQSFESLIKVLDEA